MGLPLTHNQALLLFKVLFLSVQQQHIIARHDSKKCRRYTVWLHQSKVVPSYWCMLWPQKHWGISYLQQLSLAESAKPTPEGTTRKNLSRLAVDLFRLIDHDDDQFESEYSIKISLLTRSVKAGYKGKVVAKGLATITIHSWKLYMQ